MSAAILMAAMGLSASGPAAANCKILTGKMVGFGIETVRKFAERALDQEISAWEHRASFTAKTRDRKTDCKIYIEWLNEYECTAQAQVCR